MNFEFASWFIGSTVAFKQLPYNATVVVQNYNTLLVPVRLDNFVEPPTYKSVFYDENSDIMSLSDTSTYRAYYIVNPAIKETGKLIEKELNKSYNTEVKFHGFDLQDWRIDFITKSEIFDEVVHLKIMGTMRTFMWKLPNGGCAGINCFGTSYPVIKEKKGEQGWTFIKKKYKGNNPLSKALQKILDESNSGEEALDKAKEYYIRTRQENLNYLADYLRIKTVGTQKGNLMSLL